MKKIIGVFALGISLFILASCGGNPEKEVVGAWKVDPNSIDLVLGEEFPEDLRGMVEGGKDEMKLEEAENFEKLTIEFKDGGKFIMSMEGESETIEGTWKIEDDKLRIDAEVEGEKGSVALNMDEISGDKLALSLSAEDLLSEVRTQMPEVLDEVPSMFDVEAMAKGTKFLVTLKK